MRTEKVITSTTQGGVEDGLDLVDVERGRAEARLHLVAREDLVQPDTVEGGRVDQRVHLCLFERIAQRCEVGSETGDRQRSVDEHADLTFGEEQNVSAT